MDTITSRDNKWVKEYCKLQASRAYRDECGTFTIDGIKVVTEAFENFVDIEMVFVTQICFAKYEVELEKLFQSVKLCIITEEISDKMSMQNSPQGIYAICKKLDKSLSTDKMYCRGKYIMLVDLQDAGNVGSIIRTAEAVGIDGIIVTSKTCDIYNPKVIRGSMGSLFRMNIVVKENYKDLIEQFTVNGVSTYASVVDTLATPIEKVKFADKSVLLIGNEGNGLDAEIVSLCTQKITISMAGKTESLNASMAACILMWEMNK